VLPLSNISSSGCALVCADEDAPEPGAELEVELRGGGLTMRARGRVVYALREVP